MVNLLFTCLTGFPQKDEGGPTRIIYELYNCMPQDIHVNYYSSTHRGLKNIGGKVQQHYRASLLKYFGAQVYKHFALYRNIVTTPLYLHYYHKRVQKTFQRFAGRNSFDVIHAHDPLSLYYLSSNAAKKILTIHFKGGYVSEMLEKGSLKNLFHQDVETLRNYEIESIKRADIVTFPSMAAKELFFSMNEVSCDKTKIKIIYNGVDINQIDSIIPERGLIQKYGVNTSQNFLLNVAHHSTQKNILGLLDVIKLIKERYDDKVLLLNVGFGPHTKLYTDYITENNLENNIKLIGRLSNDEVIRLMKLSDGFVLTSYNVVFDLVVLEALACGIPVFVSDDGGNREIIQNGYNGYLVNQNDAASTAEALVKYNKANVRTNARQSVQKFSLNSMTNEYVKLYNNLVRVEE